MRLRLKAMTIVGWLGAVLAAGPASADNLGVHFGVDFDAVPWATFCPGVQPVPVERGGRRCAVGHPASEYHGTFRDFSGRGKNPPANCEIVAEELRHWTTPVGQHDPWYPCRRAFWQALKERSSEPERFREPFAPWRKRYFAAWLQGEQ